jgi:hypothetical protein
MGETSKTTKIKKYYTIYEQVYETPIISVYDLSLCTGISRNTVSGYIKQMYENTIMVGPHLQLKPAPNYTEYLYLVKVSDPLSVYDELKLLPHVLYHASSFGDWNILVVTDNHMDFSQVTGFQTIVYQGKKGYTCTPKVELKTWQKSFEEIHNYLRKFTPHVNHKEKMLTPVLTWTKNEWKLYHAFRDNLRQKITPLLRKINVRYDVYVKWMKSLHTYCTIHTGFYPGGHQDHMGYSFLFDTRYPETVRSLFSLLPCTSMIIEVDSHLLVTIPVKFPEIERALLCMVNDMKTKKIIAGFSHAGYLFYQKH